MKKNLKESNSQEVYMIFYCYKASRELLILLFLKEKRILSL